MDLKTRNTQIRTLQYQVKMDCLDSTERKSRSAKANGSQIRCTFFACDLSIRKKKYTNQRSIPIEDNHKNFRLKGRSVRLLWD